MYNVSDNELQRVLQVMRQEMPNLGEALVIGQLHAMGYAVSSPCKNHGIYEYIMRSVYRPLLQISID